MFLKEPGLPELFRKVKFYTKVSCGHILNIYYHFFELDFGSHVVQGKSKDKANHHCHAGHKVTYLLSLIYVFVEFAFVL